MHILKHNKIRCKLCGDIIESKSVHDFKWCKCHSVAVDGGLEYGRYVGNPSDIELMLEWEDKKDTDNEY